MCELLLPKTFADGRDEDEVAVASNVYDYYAARAASALITASRRKRQRIRSVASEIQSQTQGSGEEGAGNGGEAQGPGRCLRRLSSQFTPLPRFTLNFPSRWV